jgi:hypothetical protein
MFNEYEDERDTVDRPWTRIPRRVVTTGIVRELVGTLADAALAAIPELSLDPFDDALRAMEAGWAAADQRYQQIVSESEADDAALNDIGEGETGPDEDALEDTE